MTMNEESEVPEGAAVFPLIPAELGIDPLLLAVLHAIVFLTGSNESVIDGDAAAEAVEHLATYLQRLDGPRLKQVREDLACLSAFAQSEQWDRPGLLFLKEFLQEFGVGQAGAGSRDEAD